VTVLETIQRSAEFLARKGVESPRLNAELLLAHVLGMPRMQLYLNFERALTAAEVEAMRHAVQRRGHREPVQHIIGTTSFCGLELAVNRHVLIPRPETELLAECGWKYLAGVPPAAATALDWGTGCGCLAIALAAHCPAARVLAVDISPEALEVARQNVARHALAARVQLALGDGFAAVPRQMRFALIVSNPPYIPSAEIQTLAPEVRQFDPPAALDGGPDGLEFIRRLASQAGEFLSAEGRLMMEFGDGQADAAAQLFSAPPWTIEAIRTDDNHRPRFIVAQYGRAANAERASSDD